MTPLYERFRDEVDEADMEGDTALYDAIHAAGDHLIAWAAKLTRPSVRLRILCLSDGRVRRFLASRPA